MTANHYTTLGVAPGADAEVIRAAYRALMRIYHPDRNEDPQAQLRAREITAAFAVLGDPEKRAAYDSRPDLGTVEPLEQAPVLWDRAPPPPPMRKLGIASVGLALAVTLAFALGPQMALKPPQLARSANHAPTVKQAAPVAVQAVAVSEDLAAPPPEVAADLPTASLADVVPVATPAAVPQDRPIAGGPIRSGELARAVMPAAPLPARAAPAEAQAIDPAPAVRDERRVKVERIASGFLKQSLEHADWHKQQLLLSARNRTSAASTMCRSDDCVTEAYLRQIRDTTTIMEGRIPTP